MNLQLKKKPQGKTSFPQKKRSHKINEEITSSSVRVIDPVSGTNEVMDLRDALYKAADLETDLVQINDDKVPVCKLIDYNKFSYQNEKAKKNNTQHQKKIKQVKFHYTIAQHDLGHKVGHIREFITKGHSVQIICQFSGRENKYRNTGKELLNSIIADLTDICKVDGEMKEDQRSIKMLLIKRQ